MSCRSGAAMAAMAALILLLAGCSRSSAVRDARERMALDSAVSLRGLLGRDCPAVYDSADAFFQGKETRDEWLAACQILRDSGEFANVISRKILGRAASDQVAVLESLPGSTPHSRELLSNWHFDGKTAKLRSLGYAEDRVALIQAPRLAPLQLAESRISPSGSRRGL